MSDYRLWRGKEVLTKKVVYGYRVNIGNKPYLFTGNMCVRDFETDIGKVALEVPEYYECSPISLGQNTFNETSLGKSIYVNDTIYGTTNDGVYVSGIVEKDEEDEFVIRYSNGAKFYLRDLNQISFLNS